MNRSAVREFSAPGTSVAAGEVLIPTEIGDPVRGPLPGPAAPLVGGSLLRKGTRVRYEPVTHCADPGQGEGGAHGLRRDVRAAGRQHGRGGGRGQPGGPRRRGRGQVGGGRVVGRVRDPQAAGGGQPVVQRREPGPGRGAEGRGRPPHRARVRAAGRRRAGVSGLAAQGAPCSSRRWTRFRTGRPLSSRLTACPLDVRAEAAERGLDVIDATCPLVAGVHAEARKFAERGDDLVLIGQAGHAAAPGILGQAPGRTTVVEPPRRARRRCG